MTTITEYGYGHTKESATIIRNELKTLLKDDVKRYNLKVSVKKSNSGYGGPDVKITTTDLSLDNLYQYIVDANGEPSNSGTLIKQPRSQFPSGRPVYSAKLIEPQTLKELNSKINKTLGQYGRDNDDSTTDYFDNTTPLFYGIQYEEK